MLNIRMKAISIMLAAVLLSGCSGGSGSNPVPSSQVFTAINAPTLQVSTQAGIPTVLMTQTSFTSTTTGGVTTSTVTAGPAGGSNDSIRTLANPSPGDTLVGAVATQPGSILLTSGAPALSMTSTSLGSTVTPLPLTSADFGVWAITNALASPLPTNSVITYSAFAGGTTLTATMPTSTATYTGKMTGVLANTPIGGSDDVSGNISLTVDFATGTITNVLIHQMSTAPGASTITPFTVYAPLQTPPLNVPFDNITLISGTVTGNSFSATVMTPAMTGATLMTMQGNFFGAAANEVAGTFTISVPSPGLKLIGSFGAKQSSQVFTALNAPTLQVSKIAMIPTLVMPQTSFNSTQAGNGVITAQVTAGATVFVATTPTTLVGAAATLNPNPGPVDYTGTVTTLGLPMTATILASTPGLVYADFGMLAVTNTITGMPADSVITYITFAGAGGTELTANMPTTPTTATYATGEMTGVLVNPPVGGVEAFLSGSVANLSADFVLNTISGTLSGTGTDGNIYPVVLSGTISGNSFTGTATTTSITTATTYVMTGNFYGPLANEVAGTFTITDPLNLASRRLIGSFGAKQ